jgi:quercetin dioxygenase-like cupin family protein
MITRRTAFFWILLLAASVTFGQSSKRQKDSQQGMVSVTPDQVRWSPAGPSLPPGAQVTLLSGDPSRPATAQVIGIKFPDGYEIPPHWLTADVSIVVVKGSLVLGLGEQFDQSQDREFPAGSFMTLPKGTPHSEWAKGETIFYSYGVGPVETVYVNPADDPRQKSGKK